MRIETTYDDEPTTVFWQPEPEAASFVESSYRPSVRSYEVHEHDVPVIPAIPMLPPSPPVRPIEVRPARHETHAIRRPSSTVGIGIGFAGLCVLVGIIVGCVIAFGTNHGSVASAAPPVAPVAHPAPAVAEIVTPVVTPAVAAVPAPTTNVIRVESDPPGATVTVVDDGKSALLGTTPLDAQVGSRSYELVFTLDNHDTKIVHFDPATDTHVAVALTAIAAEVVAAPAPAAHAHHDHHTTAAAKRSPSTKRSDSTTDTGKLEVSSKPPCTIVIDGKSTGLVTPQRALALSAGSHEITLINVAEGIHLTTAVEVAADHPTQLIRDFTN